MPTEHGSDAYIFARLQALDYLVVQIAAQLESMAPGCVTGMTLPQAAEVDPGQKMVFANMKLHLDALLARVKAHPAAQATQE